MFDRALNMILHSFSSIETAGTENWQKFNEWEFDIALLAVKSFQEMISS